MHDLGAHGLEADRVLGRLGHTRAYLCTGDIHIYREYHTVTVDFFAYLQESYTVGRGVPGTWARALGIFPTPGMPSLLGGSAFKSSTRHFFCRHSRPLHAGRGTLSEANTTRWSLPPMASAAKGSREDDVVQDRLLGTQHTGVGRAAGPVVERRKFVEKFFAYRLVFRLLGGHRRSRGEGPGSC